LQNYVYVRSLQKYLQLYYDLIGRQSLVAQEMPTPEIDATVPVPAKVGATADKRKPLVTMAELADPDSLEAKVTEHAAESLPKCVSSRNRRAASASRSYRTDRQHAIRAATCSRLFEAEMAKPTNQDRAFTERARGVADESEELLSMEADRRAEGRRCSGDACSDADGDAGTHARSCTGSKGSPDTDNNRAAGTSTGYAASAGGGRGSSTGSGPGTRSSVRARVGYTTARGAFAPRDAGRNSRCSWGLLGEEPPAQQASPQLELLGDDRKLMSG
jgi:hypothetical protein